MKLFVINKPVNMIFGCMPAFGLREACFATLYTSYSTGATARNDETLNILYKLIQLYFKMNI